METVEVVIKMSKDIYESFNESFNDPFDGMWKHYLIPCAYAIKNGTVLPKGHGRLIDADEVYKKFYCRCLAGAATEVLNEIPTIIEADREE